MLNVQSNDNALWEVYQANNPLGISSNVDKIPFHPYYTFKDLVGVLVFFLIFFGFVFYQPNLLGQGWPFIIRIL
jgi:ubiquinol-cytochrome c reductase cytochrome b subunit